MGLTLLGDDSEQITRGQDEVFLTVVLDFSSAVLSVQDDVAFLDVEWNAAFAVFIPAAGADCHDGCLERLFLSGIGNHQTGSGGGLSLDGLNENLVLERLNFRYDDPP